MSTMEPGGGGLDVMDRELEKLLEEEAVEPGDHERFSHYVKKEKILQSAISGKPVYVQDGHVGDLTTLEPYQRDHPYHRTAVGRLRNGQTALVVIGGAGTSARQFAQALIGLGFVEALGMDIDSSANVNWRGTSVNRPDYQRQVPTGIIAFRRVG